MAIRDEIIIKENINDLIILGHSLGAYLLFSFLDLYPSKIKGFVEYCRTEHPKIISEDLRISKETRQQYLSHVPNDLLDYLTIKEIFAWKKGSAYFCDRKYFHCSDNYIAQGLTNKRALIFWTSVIEK